MKKLMWIKRMANEKLKERGKAKEKVKEMGKQRLGDQGNKGRWKE